jgi:hypothetical protein
MVLPFQLGAIIVFIVFIVSAGVFGPGGAVELANGAL